MLIDDLNTRIESLQKSFKNGRKLVIWGAGEGGKSVYNFCKFIGIDIAYFIDKAYESKEGIIFGKKIFGIKYVQDNMLSVKEDKPYILVSSMYYKEIAEQLSSWGYDRECDFCFSLDFADAHDEYIDLNVRKYIGRFYPNDIPLFNNVELETINRCNMDCEFCPVNRNSDSRELKKMPEKLYDSILIQLQHLNYDGRFSLYSNNEPFMDKRFLDFLEKARHMLPHAHLHLYTNGTLMSLEKFKTTMIFLDTIIIDNYSNDYEFVASIKEIHEFCKANKDIGNKVKIYKRRKNQELTTRGGQAPNREKINMKSYSCINPFVQLVIRPDGKISLCCNDALGKYTLGDLQKETISDIWYGEKYKEIRQKILDGRENISLCMGCDTMQDAPGKDGKFSVAHINYETLLEVWP